MMNEGKNGRTVLNAGIQKRLLEVLLRRKAQKAVCSFSSGINGGVMFLTDRAILEFPDLGLPVFPWCFVVLQGTKT